MKRRMLSLVLAVLMAVMVLPFAALTENAAAADEVTYTVLILDAGGTFSFRSNGEIFYRADSAIDDVKEAASTFLLDVIKSSGKNYVAVISYNDAATVVSDFTDDLEGLRQKVSKIEASGERDIANALYSANDLLSQVPDADNVKKSAVLFTTGSSYCGDYSDTGHYDSSTVASDWYSLSTGIEFYKYGNVAYSAAANLKKQADLYVIGLFGKMDGVPERGKPIVQYFRVLARDLASAEEVFYECDDPDDLPLAFGDVADSVTDVIEFPFEDVKHSDWYYRAVKYVWKHSLMSGTADNRFDPEITTTRAMIVMVLYNFEGKPEVKGKSSFKDVPKGEWFDAAVTWAEQNKIVNGVTETRFAPTDNITREQMAAILYRYSEYKEFDVSPRADLGAFNDAWQISDYAVENIKWAVARGYINGTTDTTVEPTANATRAQVATIFHRFFQDVL